MLRDRRKLQDSLRAYRAGEIPAVAGEGEGHFIVSIERRLRSLNAELRAMEAAVKMKRKEPPLSGPPQLHDR